MENLKSFLESEGIARLISWDQFALSNLIAENCLLELDNFVILSLLCHSFVFVTNC